MLTMGGYVAVFLYICVVVSLVWSALYNVEAKPLFREAAQIFFYFVAGCSAAGALFYVIG